MPNFISSTLVSESFKRLTGRDPSGKKHLERTSALLYFLAFDATCKFFDTKTLDFNPASFIGKSHRRQFELEFTRLVVLERNPEILKQVIELGVIDVNGTNPEQRISSNFFSVAVKKASERNEPYPYPSRPKAPMISLGFSEKNRWKATFHEEWASNFPKLLSEVKQPTPNIDLAIFIVRDTQLRDNCDNVFNTIIDALKKKFTTETCNYFSSKFENEKMFAEHTKSPFSDHYIAFSKEYQNGNSRIIDYKKMKKEDLIHRVIELENILRQKKISF